MFPKFPQSSLGIPRVPQLPPPLEHPPLKNPTTIRRTKMSVPNSHQLNNGAIFHNPFWTKARYGNGECLCTGWCCDGAADEHSHLEPLGMGILFRFFFLPLPQGGPRKNLEHFTTRNGGSNSAKWFFFLGKKNPCGPGKVENVFDLYTPFTRMLARHPPGWRITLPKFNIAPEISNPKRKVIFQPSFFRGYVKLPWCRYFGVRKFPELNCFQGGSKKYVWIC